MSYELDTDELKVNFEPSKFEIPYGAIKDIQLSHLALELACRCPAVGFYCFLEL